MKRSILTLAAAATLGMAGSAHAVIYFGDLNNTDGDMRMKPNGQGHALIMPYFNAQGATSTALHLTNSNPQNSIAVKVHVRGAANGDSLLDFTVLLAPNDAWTATLVNKGGMPRIISGDTSCVLTNDGAASKLDQPLSLDNLAPYLSDAAKKEHAGEGYMEFITMANIDASSPLGKAIKSRDCTSAVVQELLSTKKLTASEATDLGLQVPFPYLSGIYYVINQEKVAAYSGGMIAFLPESGNRHTRIVFAPQSTAEVGYSCTNPDGTTWSPCMSGLVSYGALSADPLLNSKSRLHQLPDLSTPLTRENPTPKEHIGAIEGEMLHSTIVNDAVSAPNGAVPMLTDWVLSHPLRRYSIAVQYGSTEAEAKIVEGAAWQNRYYASLKNPWANKGPFACFYSGQSDPFSGPNRNSIYFFDREGSAGVDIQGNYPGTCGAVSTIGFAQESPLDARVARSVLTLPKAEGWVRFGGFSFPVTGFAAFSAKNTQTNIIYSTTWPHR